MGNESLLVKQQGRDFVELCEQRTENSKGSGKFFRSNHWDGLPNKLRVQSSFNNFVFHI
jgi:hypothetical protein